ncbi:sucrose-6-Phosphate hydrolase [Arthrobacter sp. Hiyo8]|nr:sucrose-6-Phosphate hydrolase [Arthrobacter sp. Hiyo8]
MPSDEAASDGDDTWVMMFSLWLSGDDHEHANGVGHLIGSLAEDPSTGLPVFVPRSGGRSDLGRDFYAPQIVQLDTASSSGSESEPRALLWGWPTKARVVMAGVAVRRTRSTPQAGQAY